MLYFQVPVDRTLLLGVIAESDSTFCDTLP